MAYWGQVSVEAEAALGVHRTEWQGGLVGSLTHLRTTSKVFSAIPLPLRKAAPRQTLLTAGLFR